MKLSENQLFDNRYLLKARIGSGGFSEVWLAEDSKSGNMQVALKVFATNNGLDSEGLAEFSKEYSLVFNLNHPNLLKPMHYDDWNDMPFLVLQFMPNGSAAKLCGKISESELAKFLLQIGGALEYLHEQDPPIIHQDIKPDNILIDAKGNYLLTDFGISTKIRRTLTKSMGKQQSSAGTTAYMAPERFSKNLDERTPIKANDVFSFGVTIFELLTDELPYGEHGGMVANTGNEPSDLPEKFNPDLRLLVSACLTKDPWDRPTSKDLLNSANHFSQSKVWSLPDNISSKLQQLNKISLNKTQEVNIEKLNDSKQTTVFQESFKNKNSNHLQRKKKSGLIWLILTLFIAFITIILFKSDIISLKNNQKSDIQISEITPVSVQVSSVMNSSQGLNYAPENMFDDNYMTWWSPGAPYSNGYNSWIRINLDKKRIVHKISILNGSFYPDFRDYGDLYLLNNRLIEAVIEFSNGESYNIILNDHTKEMQDISFSQKPETEYIIIYPLKWNDGSKWRDLCISEIKIYGE